MMYSRKLLSHFATLKLPSYMSLKFSPSGATWTSCQSCLRFAHWAPAYFWRRAYFINVNSASTQFRVNLCHNFTFTHDFASFSFSASFHKTVIMHNGGLILLFGQELNNFAEYIFIFTFCALHFVIYGDVCIISFPLSRHSMPRSAFLHDI